MKNKGLELREQGFSLIEILVVLVIVAVIAMIAMPSYSGRICKVERDQARGDLLAFAQALERYYTENNFKYRAADGSMPSVFPSFSPADGSAADKQFDLTATIPNDGRSFSVSAARSGGSCQDGTLSLSNTGARTWTRGGATQVGWDE